MATPMAATAMSMGTENDMSLITYLLLFLVAALLVAFLR